jgi:hypothetical protein
VIDEITDEVLLLKNNGTVFIPTVSQWGMIILALTLLLAGSMVAKRRRSGLSTDVR